jgi:hypothetical protein
MDESQELNQEQVQRLAGLAEEAERELALVVQNQSNRAFNLGCALWFIPGAVVVLAAFWVSKGNWVIAFLLAVLVGLWAVGFALVSAYNTKRKATDRLYHEITLPQLDQALAESHLSRPAFERIALQTLPSDALLYQLLGKHSQDEETASKDIETGSKPNE